MDLSIFEICQLMSNRLYLSDLYSNFLKIEEGSPIEVVDEILSRSQYVKEISAHLQYLQSAYLDSIQQKFINQEHIYQGFSFS